MTVSSETIASNRQMVIRPGSRAGIRHWPKRARKKACALYLENGSLDLTAELIGCNRATIWNWQQTEEWRETEQELLTEIDASTKTLLRDIVNKGYSATLEAIEHGDSQLARAADGTVELVRVPMKGKDLAITASVALDKLRLAEGKPGQITATTDALQRAADAFVALGSQYRMRTVSEQ